TTAARAVWQQATASDFSAGTFAGTALASPTAGGVQLAPTFADDFTGTALNTAAWAKTAWGSGAKVAVSGGVVSVAASAITSAKSAGSSGVSGSVNFAAAPYQHFGLATGLATAAGNSWAIFSTAGTTNTLYARVNANGRTQDVRLGALPTGFHTYAVQPVAG